MGLREEDSRIELADANKIISNLWTMTMSTKKLPELFDRLQGLFTSEERSNLHWLQDDHLKCFLLYGKFIRDYQNMTHQALLLKALRATDNSVIADQIKQTDTGTNIEKNKLQINSTPISTISGLLTGDVGNDLSSTKNPVEIHYEVNGKNKNYSTPESLRISQGLHHVLTTLKLTDVQVTKTILKMALKPCVSLQDLQLHNVSLLNCETNNNGAINENEETETNSQVILPQLKNYLCHCNTAESENYSWDTIFFFSILKNLPTTLLTFWSSQTNINVITNSMTVQVNPNQSNIFIHLPKKEYYDSPHFIPYISTESIREFFSRQTRPLKSFSCLLPLNFDTVDFFDLPNDVRNLRVSGLTINFESGRESVVKSYEMAIFEKCFLSQSFIDEIFKVMPLAKTVQLKECQVANSEGADINITVVY